MGIVNRPYGRVLTGHTLPYGTLADASYELKQAYYNFGYLHDEDLPELPVWEPEPVEVDLDEKLWAEDISRLIHEALDNIPRRRAKVLRLRYGIGCAEMTLEEVGRAYDLTRERIRQLEAEGLRALKHPLRCPELQAVRKFIARW